MGDLPRVCMSLYPTAVTLFVWIMLNTYIPRLKRVEDLNDVNKRSLYFANVDFMNVTERRTAYLYADLCTRVSILYIIS